MSARSTLAWGLVLSAAVSACGAARSGGTAAGAPTAGSCVVSAGEAALAPLTDAGVSSAVALARWNGRVVALVADEDDRSLHAIDVERRSELGETPLAGVPSQILVASDGRVLVALRDASRVQVLAPARGAGPWALAARCAVATPVDPVSIAEAPDHGSFAVSSAWGHALTVLRASDLAVQRSIDLPREPRGVVFASDGTRVFVAHAVGAGMSIADVTTGAIRSVDARGPAEARPLRSDKGPAEKAFRRSSGQGFALAKVGPVVVEPRVLVDPGGPEALVTYYGGDGPTEIADALVVDERSERPFASALPMSGRRLAPLATVDGAGAGAADAGCLLPRGVAARPDEGTVLVTCLGSDTLVEYVVDTPNAGRRAVPRRRWSVGSGPMGVAYDPSGQAVVWSQFDRAVTFVPMPTGSLEDRVARGPGQVSRLMLGRSARLEVEGEDAGDVQLGRKLYHAAGNRALTSDGRACESCHPEGRDDGLTWQTPEGPRRTAMLAGRLDGTAPYGWNGQSKDLPSHIRETIAHLGGSGLADRELAAIVAYCRTMKSPPPEHESLEALTARGKAVFESPQAACTQCHTSARGAPFTDGARHDVQSRTPSDTQALFDTPSLRSVGGRAPYFHDGRYATLGELLDGVDGTMGHTAQLSPDDRAALQAYLRSL
jgi:DNA-binding beta-propeller fold protein YncE/mono/diheme cytochrome c family protein